MIKKKTLKRRTSIGIDIGNKNIKIVEISKEKKKINIVNKIIIPNVQNFLKNNKIVDKEKFADTLETIFDTHKISKKNLNISISPDIKNAKHQSYVVRTFKQQMLTTAEMKKSMSYILEKEMPIPLEQYYTDWDIAKTFVEGGIEKGLIFAIAVHKDLVDSLMQTFKILKIQPNHFDFSILATARSLINPKFYGELDENYILIDFGYSETRVLVLNKGIPYYYRSIKISTDTFIKRIAGIRGVSENYAEEILQNETGISVKDKMNLTYEEENNGEILLDDLNTIVYGLEEIIGYISNKGGISTIDKIYITGGGSKIKNIKDYLSDALKIPVYDLIPYFITPDSDIYLQYGEDLSFINTAIGLALRGFEK